MKTNAQVLAMLRRVENSDALQENIARGPLIMAFEWVLNGSLSTSMGLEDWLEEESTRERRLAKEPQ